MNNKNGATLIELIITITIVSILAAVSAGIIISVMQMFIYLPREMTARSVAAEAVDIMIDGQSLERGMRYAVQVQDASPTQFVYTFGYPGNADKKNIKFQLSDGKIYRYSTVFGDPITGPPASYGPAEIIPYYAQGDISISGPSGNPGTIFTYFKQGGSPWVSGVDSLNDIKRVDITIVVKTGSGLFENWESSFQTTSGTEIDQYI